MAQSIILKRSAVPGKVPTTSSLNIGEVALNTNDGRVFINVSSSLTSSIQHIVTTDSVTTGSITITRTGSFGELVVTQDGNFQRDIFVTRDIVGNGDIDIGGTLTASLQQGYTWVGDSTNTTKLVATSSFGGAGSSTPNAYTHTQGVQSSTWTVQHNLDNNRPVITVYDINNNVIIPENIKTIDSNQTEIRFSYPTTGYATVAAAAGTIVSSATSASFATNALTASYALAGISGYFGANFDGQGVGISPGSLSYFRIPKAGTITAWSIIADGTWPTMSLNVWKTGSGAFLPTSASTIIGTLNYRPFISASRNAIRSTDLTSWTTSFAANDIFAVQVVSSSIATKCNFVLECQWTV